MRRNASPPRGEEDDDEGVKRTNADAQCAKLSCVLRGYFSDDYFKHFVNKADSVRIRSLPPLINRGCVLEPEPVRATRRHATSSHWLATVGTTPGT